MADEKKTTNLVDVGELADILSIPKSWIYQQTSMGQEGIPHYKLGKYVRFDVEEVKAFFHQTGNE